MRWEDERYVKVFTRDTPEWCVLSWEARGFFLLLLRAVDRAGILSLGKAGLRGLAAMLHMPADVVARAVAELEQDGCISVTEARILVRNFEQAQSASASDKARQQASRERARAQALAEVTGKTDEKDPASRAVTDRHAPSQHVTLSLAEPSLAEPRQTQSAAPAVAVAGSGSRSRKPKPPPHQPTADDQAVFTRWRERHAPKAPPLVDAGRARTIAARRAERVAAGRTYAEAQQDLLDALDGWRNDPWPERRRHSALDQLLGNAGDVDRGLTLLATGPPIPGRDAANADPSLYTTTVVGRGNA